MNDDGTNKNKIDKEYWYKQLFLTRKEATEIKNDEF